ncbi:MAG: hypothetical protein HY556_04040 [Euryarchaeota archaeon]|nr:hypothetical protein [Euryarchaeota archaeon]
MTDVETGETETGAAETMRRNRVAAQILQEYLDGRFLPPFVAGEPRHLGAALGATAIGEEILGMLAAVYGVTQWDFDSFKRHVLEGALPAWKRDTVLTDSGTVVKVRSTICPLEPEARLDPRICDMCKLTQEILIKGAAGPEILDATFTHTVAKGDPSCDLVIRRRSADAARRS